MLINGSYYGEPICHLTIFPGDTPLHKSERHVPSERVWFLWCFGLKTGIDLAHFGLETMVLRELQERSTHSSFQFPMNQKERLICKFGMDFKKKSFCWPSNLSNDYVNSTFVNMYVAFCDLLWV